MTKPSQTTERLFDNPVEVTPHPAGSGTQRFYKFPNGYGASVIRFVLPSGYGSYTDNEQEWELAVLDADRRLTYETPITDDVMGHLSEAEVEEVLKQIEALPAAPVSEGEQPCQA